MMNTDLITFFSSRDSGQEPIRVFTVEMDDVPGVEILVYSRERIDLSRPALLAINSEEDYLGLIDEIRKALAPVGGILAQLQPHNNVTHAALTLVAAPGYKPPRQMFHLTPSGAPRFEDIPRAESPIAIELGDHIVVPVSAEAEVRLRTFHEELKGFPRDLEDSILTVIRRPSLEWRIERLEHALSLPAAGWAEQQRSRARPERLWEKLFRIVMRPVPIGPAIAAALLLATAAGFAAGSWSSVPPAPRKAPATSEPRYVRPARPGPKPEAVQPSVQVKSGKTGPAEVGPAPGGSSAKKQQEPKKPRLKPKR